MARLPFIDWVRGGAVIAMVLWHTADGWLSPGVRSGQGWLCLRFIGGLAAPAFLFLAGAGAALSAGTPKDAAERERAFRTRLVRGLEIAILGYLLRFQAWVVDAGALAQASMARSFVPLGLGYAALLWTVRRATGQSWRNALVGLLGAALVGIGLLQVESVAPGRLLRLIQVDVLQAIGTSLVLLACLERTLGLLRRPAAALASAVVLASLTHVVWTHLPGPLPHAVAGFLGKYTPAPGAPSALFPLFPWFAYACAGAAVGSWLRDAGPDADRRIVQLGLGGAVVALIASEAHPWLQDLFVFHPWTVQPIRVAFRSGIVLSLFIVGWAWATPPRGRILLDYGHASLRIYWAHMFFAYGLLGRPFSKQLSYGSWALGALALLGSMWLVAQVGVTPRRLREPQSPATPYGA